MYIIKDNYDEEENNNNKEKHYSNEEYRSELEKEGEKIFYDFKSYGYDNSEANAERHKWESD